MNLVENREWMIYLSICSLLGKSCRKIRENSGAQNYSDTKLGLIRVPWLFLLQFVPLQKCTLNRNKKK